MSRATGIVPRGTFAPRRRRLESRPFSGLGCDCQGRSHVGRLGRLGLNTTGKAITETAVTKGSAAGASAVAAWAGAGAAAGPIGIAVGAVLGIVAGSLLAKNYLNVGNVNVGEDQAVQAYNQYAQIAGTVPGRAFGLHAMEVVWHGYFYTNPVASQGKQPCYHEGCFKYPGDPSWIDDTLGLSGSCGAHNCFPDAYAAWRAAGNPNPASTVPDAVTFIDHFLLPMNQGAQFPWIVQEAANPMGHQVLYDVADAYLAGQAVTTTAYIAHPTTATAVANSTPPAGAAAPPVRTPIASPAAASAAAAPPAIGAAVTAIPGFTSVPTGLTFAGEDPSGNWVVRDAAGNLWDAGGGQFTPYAPPSAPPVYAGGGGSGATYQLAPPAAAVPAGATAALAVGGVPSWLWVAGGGLLLVAVLKKPAQRPPRRSR